MEAEKNIAGGTLIGDLQEDADQQISRISIPRIREPRDMVYSGTINVPQTGRIPVGSGVPAGGKKKHKRSVSTFSAVLILIALAVSSVLYIGNILVVGRLMNQINQLQNRHRQILNQQELLRAQIIKLSNLERIRSLAGAELGLQNSKQLPVWIEIDPEQVEQVQEVIQQQMENKR
jgi:hypothetical protein